MITPQLTAFEAQSQQTFQALMWALSYPGRAQRIAEVGVAAFAAVGATLIDLETSYYTNHAGLAQLLAHSGARTLGPQQAHYQFYPDLPTMALDDLALAPVGTYLDPDASATLVLSCHLGAGERLRLSGPGIPAPFMVNLGGLPPGFWELRTKVCQFPLGWDIFFIAHDHLIGLPRTTTVEVL
ncbi:phosphonate metabolism protein PhnH [Oscillochloris trichoides DG-6]|uniref:Phosphonate metabolism protein PhnH n=1 Tax=Oscillochloris trichoides DG-6 TaxID=765420 RepID=E1IFF1_9CHLR|nr:phosphonate C-P lyase system protein PhnH [Oscillochloris trichoides]EFO80061.1 phosphonate metabolism protein PhnH [Oscillochloris trichoides DG-6]